MAAYAAVSLMHAIEQILNHPRPPISLERKQFENLIEKINFFQEDFLESYSHGGSNLETRIAGAAYAAEDIIESHVMDQNHAASKRKPDHGETEKTRSIIEFYQSLQKMIEDMDSIKEEVMEIKEKTGVHGDQLYGRNSIMPTDSLRSFPPTVQKQNIMVGFDDVLNHIMDKLTNGQPSARQIIPIIGMGGIGKTTLARNAYVQPLIVHHFDIRAWVAISQEYNAREILLEVLVCLTNQESKENFSGKSEDDLGIMIHKSLSGRRYLIIMDDTWSIDAWETMMLFFPDNNNGSRIIMTSRLLNVAFQLTGSHGLEMKLLDGDTSWNLLCKTVFGGEDCPLELERIGKKIAINCKGLPLSIVTIGGLLRKSKLTREYWEYIAKNLTSLVNLEDNEHCLKILHVSYKQLPVHLKPCFLYMGTFLEDEKIRVSDLIKLWVSEGFLKPIRGKSLEEVAVEYLKDLINRNLILVDKFGSSGKIKLCNIHDLLRDLCLREAQKENFLCVTGKHSTIKGTSETGNTLALANAFVHYYALFLINFGKPYETLPKNNVRMSRVWDMLGESRKYPALYSSDKHAIFRLASLRHIAMEFVPTSWLSPRQLCWELSKMYFRNPNSFAFQFVTFTGARSKFPYSFHFFWNLHTLIFPRTVIKPNSFDIWKMPQLKHVKFLECELPDPTRVGTDVFVLENLQTLLKVKKFKCSEEVVYRIPNIRKLQIHYDFKKGSPRFLNNLCHLHKHESFSCLFLSSELPSTSSFPRFLKEPLNLESSNFTFPHSLKKLSLEGSCLHWEEDMTKIGSLPLLEVLKLKQRAFMGPVWETVEDQFRSLKFLEIGPCDLECWSTDSTHFPRLERLVLRGLSKLNDVPWGTGEIPTLESIQLEDCSDSAAISAKEIADEQEQLHVQVDGKSNSRRGKVSGYHWSAHDYWRQAAFFFFSFFLSLIFLIHRFFSYCSAMKHYFFHPYHLVCLILFWVFLVLYGYFRGRSRSHVRPYPKHFSVLLVKIGITVYCIRAFGESADCVVQWILRIANSCADAMAELAFGQEM